MKTKKYFSIVITILFAFLANAQTVTLYTPSGSSVQAFMQSEMSASDITYYTKAYRAGYPQATVLANASSTYNCHSYAWNISEGGTSICWLNQAPDLHKYWDDFSYEETTEANAEKIFYFNGDHSAIKSTTVAGKYESKWGPMPKMRHAPDYGPSDYNMSYRRYYAKFSSLHPISGSSQLCSQGTYTINNLPVGATVVWSSSNTSVATVAGSGSTATLTKNISNGSTTLSAIINGSMTITKSIWVGAPIVSKVSGLSYCLLGSSSDYYASIDPLANATSYSWTLTPSFNNSVNPSGDRCYIQWNRAGTYVLEMHAQNACGTSTSYMYPIWVGGGSSFSLSPNPASSQVEVSMIAGATTMAADATTSTFNTASVESLGATSYSVKILDSYGSTVYSANKKEKKFNISTSSFRNGIYGVIISDGTNVYQSKLIVKH